MSLAIRHHHVRGGNDAMSCAGTSPQLSLDTGGSGDEDQPQRLDGMKTGGEWGATQ